MHSDILQTILFTMDDEILEAMAQYDQTYDGNEEDEDELLRSCYFERPSTADQDEEGVSIQLSHGNLPPTSRHFSKREDTGWLIPAKFYLFFCKVISSQLEMPPNVSNLSKKELVCRVSE